MDEQSINPYHDILDRNYEIIAKEMADERQIDNIASQLCDLGIVPDHIIINIVEMETTERNKARQLLYSMQGKSRDDFKSFIKILIFTGLSQSAAIFGDTEFYDQGKCLSESIENLRLLPYKNRLNSRDQLEPPSASALPLEEFTPCTPLSVRVQPAKYIFEPDVNCTDMYKNTSMPRSLVLLINYKHFANDVHPTRNGSEIDVLNLTKLFTQMGCCIEPHYNLTKHETLKVLRGFCTKPELKNVDSCHVIIMSHGRDDKTFFTSDNVYINVNEVLEEFSNAKCPHLKHKPKVFIFQYCRGNNYDQGVRRVNYVLPSRMETDSSAHGEVIFNHSPTFTDMFQIYSCVEGFVSFRHPERGSWLIEALCLVWMEFAHKDDLDSLMKRVSRHIRTNYSDEGSKQQCVWHSIGFDRHFYFNPKPLPEMIDTMNASDARDLSHHATSIHVKEPPHRTRHRSYDSPRSGTPDLPELPGGYLIEGNSFPLLPGLHSVNSESLLTNKRFGGERLHRNSGHGHWTHLTRSFDRSLGSSCTSPSPSEWSCGQGINSVGDDNWGSNEVCDYEGPFEGANEVPLDDSNEGQFQGTIECTNGGSGVDTVDYQSGATSLTPSSKEVRATIPTFHEIQEAVDHRNAFQRQLSCPSVAEIYRNLHSVKKFARTSSIGEKLLPHLDGLEKIMRQEKEKKKDKKRATDTRSLDK